MARLTDIKTDRPLVLCLAALTLGAMAKFIAFRLIPGVDMPNHLAVATIWKHAGDPATPLNRFFSLQSNLSPGTFHPWFCALPIFPTVEIGNSVFLSLYSATLILTVLLILRELKGNLWFTILSVPFIHNFNVSWGFVGYVGSLPLVLLFMLLTLRYRDRSPVAWTLMTAPLLVWLYFAHFQALLFVLLVHVSWSLMRAVKFPRGFTPDLIALIPVAVLTARWIATLDQQWTLLDQEYLLSYYSGPAWSRVLHRLWGILSVDNYFLAAGEKGVIVASLLAGSIALLVVLPLVSRIEGRFQTLRTTNGKRVVLLGVLALGCFLLLPPSLPGQDYVNQRFAVLFFLSLVIVGGTVNRKILSPAIKTAFMITAIVSTLLWYDYYNEFNQSNRHLQPGVFPREDSQSVSTALIFDLFFRGQHMNLHLANYHIVWNQGIITTAIVDYRFSLVRRSAAHPDLPRFDQRAGVYPWNVNQADLKTKYVVTKGIIPRRLSSLFRLMHKVRRDGDWNLWEREDM